jgi:hypothetical protein
MLGTLRSQTTAEGPMRRITAPRLLAAIGFTALVLSPSAPAWASHVTPKPVLPTTGLFLQRWAPASMAGKEKVTQSEAVSIARDYDVITAEPTTFAPYVSAMHAANPDVTLLTYMNASFANTSTEYPSSWYARDANGNLVRSTGVGVYNGGGYLMDMSNPAWIQSLGSQCAQELTSSGYAGCYYGMLSLAIFTPHYLDATPIDPATGLAWTEADWITALENAVTTIEQANPGIIVAGNTLGGGGTYFKTNGTSTRPLLDLESAGQAEDFLRGATYSPTKYPKASIWLNQIKMLVNAGSRGDVVLAQTKLWVTATSAQVDAWHTFTLASFLLGTNGRSYYSFSIGHTMADLTADSSYDTVDVGTPTGSYALVDGVYQRQFTAGFAAVNVGSKSQTIPLSGCVTDLEGNTHPSSVVIAPDSGNVFLADC